MYREELEKLRGEHAQNTVCETPKELRQTYLKRKLSCLHLILIISCIWSCLQSCRRLKKFCKETRSLSNTAVPALVTLHSCNLNNHFVLLIRTIL